MISDKIKKSIVKYLTNQATISELRELEIWLQDTNNKSVFTSYVKTNYAIEYNMRKFDSDKVNKELLAVIAKDRKVIKLKKLRKVLLYAAASIVIGILTTTYVFRDNLFDNPIDTAPIIVDTNKIVPGTDKATLTLEDGSVVELDKDNNPKIKNASSNGKQLVYKPGEQNSKEIAYNYLTIPRGGQFFIILSDGTQVWLNSESQLKYPVSFQEGKIRQVELIYGEAYFDVSPSKEHRGSKFMVLNQSQEVEVLGTEFNIKAYKDETNIYTTLVEGKVTIDNGVSKQNLAPNQQSNLNITNKKLLVKEVDVNTEISWKNGVFSFKETTLKDIMKVISRWYDVEVIFENKDLEPIKFKGIIGKQQTIEEILSIMKSNTINSYEIKNKTLILK